MPRSVNKSSTSRKLSVNWRDAEKRRDILLCKNAFCRNPGSGPRQIGAGVDDHAHSQSGDILWPLVNGKGDLIEVVDLPTLLDGPNRRA
jgi:hypothetical protein